MLEQIEITHSADNAIKAVFGRPSRAAFAEWWDAVVAARGRPSYTANSNLAIACRVSPSPTELASLLTEEWSALPNDVCDVLTAMSGFFGIADAPSESSNKAEIVDLRALNGNVAHISPDEQKAALAKAEAHRSAMLALGISEGQLATWLHVRNPHITRLCVALPWGGYHIARAPSASDRAHASDVHNASGEGSGPFEAKVALVLACSLWPNGERVAAGIDARPGAAAKLGAMIEALGGGYQVALKK